MKNLTSVQFFHLMAFSGNKKNKLFISSFFFLIYFVGVLMNSSIITVICLEPHLHHPMYLFICNLSIVDIFYTTVIVPKLLDMLISGNDIVSYAQCYSQLYFFIAVASAEEILLFVMAYDRYVSICIPLHYHRIMSRIKCTLMTIGIWVAACLNALLFTISVLKFSSCHSNTIHQLFCDAKSLTRISCTSTEKFYIVLGIDILLLGLGPFLFSLISYINIFSIILRIKSSDGRRKAFSTCSSHLSIITMYYMSSISVYLLPTYSEVLDLVLTVAYTTITPMLNPIIYSLQNSDVKMALQKLVREIYIISLRLKRVTTGHKP